MLRVVEVLEQNPRFMELLESELIIRFYRINYTMRAYAVLVSLFEGMERIVVSLEGLQ